MIWPFGPKPFLEPEIEDWHLETWAWLLRNLGGLEELREALLVLPRAEFFPASDKTGEERAHHLFQTVRELAGMEQWPAVLSVQPDYMTPAGTFSSVVPGTTTPAPRDAGPGEWEALVTYNPRLLNDPGGLVATFAHELSHYKLGYVEESPPGGHELHELATDLTVVFLGFGVFGAQTAVRVHGGAIHWQGYLSPRGWAFALAVFLLLRDESPEPLRPHVDVRVWEDLLQAIAYLERDPERLARVLP